MNKKYSSFSGLKGLLYTDWYDRILTGDLKPPVNAVIDLTDRCNLKCEWCNSQAYRSSNTLELESMKKLIDDIAAWGIRSVCYAGGGEPTLHPDFAEIIRYTRGRGLAVGISTNGTNLTDEVIDAIAECAAFCGVSIDAGSGETWARLKGVELWDDVLNGCRKLVEKAKCVDLTYKFLISESNQYEILDACRLAKELGFRNFFMRPAAFENIPGVGLDYDFDTVKIGEQIDACIKEETSIFRVYGSFGRVDENLRMTHPYERCRATPLSAIFCADGYCYLCIDRRERDDSRMCRHEDIRKFWGSREHWEMLKNIKLETCPRCTFGNYNEQIEHYMNDTFFIFFP